MAITDAISIAQSTARPRYQNSIRTVLSIRPPMTEIPKDMKLITSDTAINNVFTRFISIFQLIGVLISTVLV